MSYEQALKKAWDDLSKVTTEPQLAVRFLSDTYDVDPVRRQVLSSSCNTPAKDYVAIIVLHYLTQKLIFNKLPLLTKQWIDFNQLEGGEAYYKTFRKRTIEHIIKKFGSQPAELLISAKRFPYRDAKYGDVGIIIKVFDEVDILITLWKGDEEFGSDANILYDKNISKIFCTEDVVVLTEILIHQL